MIPLAAGSWLPCSGLLVSSWRRVAGAVACWFTDSCDVLPKPLDMIVRVWLTHVISKTAAQHDRNLITEQSPGARSGDVRRIAKGETGPVGALVPQNRHCERAVTKRGTGTRPCVRVRRGAPAAVGRSTSTCRRLDLQPASNPCAVLNPDVRSCPGLSQHGPSAVFTAAGGHCAGH